MLARIILFCLFGAIILFVASLSGYKTLFSADKGITAQALTSPSAEKLALTQKPGEGEELEASKPKEVSFEVALTTDALKRAHKIYTETAQCIKCHGQYGEGNSQEQAPLIGGQYDWYVLEQLHAMKKGERVNEKMQPYIESLTDQDFNDLAEYITLLRVPKRGE